MRLASATSRAIVTTAAFAAAALVYGCAFDRNEQDETITLRVGAATPILQLANTSENYLRAALTKESLLTIGDDGRLRPRVVESWSSSEDGLIWWLHVRKGVKFHDGSTVTAADIAPRIVRPRPGTVPGSRVLSARAVDAHVIEVKLTEPSSFFLEDLATVDVEKQIRDGFIGMGPFVTEPPAVAGQPSMTFRAFPDYYRGAPAIDRVEIRTYEDLRRAWSALMRGEIDFLYEVTRDAQDFVEAETSVEVSTFLRPFAYVLGFNPDRPQLRSPLVRRAINLAVDRPRLIREAFNGRAEPAWSHVWPHHWAHDAAVAPPRFDPTEAARMIDASGVPAPTGPGMPSRLRFTAMVYAPLERVALALQRQLAQVGIDMRIEIPETNDLLQRMSTGDYDAFMFEMASARVLKYPYFFWHSKGSYRSAQFGNSYDAADGALDRIRLARNETDYRAGVAAFQRVLADDPPAVFLAWGQVARAVKRSYDIPAEQGADIYHTISQWKPARPGGSR